MYASQPEILEYLRSVARNSNLYDKIKFRHSVLKSVWDSTISKWKILVQNPQGQKIEYVIDILYVDF